MCVTTQNVPGRHAYFVGSTTTISSMEWYIGLKTRTPKKGCSSLNANAGKQLRNTKSVSATASAEWCSLGSWLTDVASISSLSRLYSESPFPLLYWLSTYMGTKRDVDSIELSEPVTSPSRGVHDVVVANVHDTLQVLVEEQPGGCQRSGQHNAKKKSAMPGGITKPL